MQAMLNSSWSKVVMLSYLMNVILFNDDVVFPFVTGLRYTFHRYSLMKLALSSSQEIEIAIHELS